MLFSVVKCKKWLCVCAKNKMLLSLYQDSGIRLL